MKKFDGPLQQILRAIKGLESGQKSLESGQKSLENGQRSLEEGQKRLEQGFVLQQKEIAGIQAKLHDVHTEVRHQGVRQEAMDDKLSLIVEAVSPQFEKHAELKQRVDRHDDTLTVHDLRLRKLEH